MITMITQLEKSESEFGAESPLRFCYCDHHGVSSTPATVTRCSPADTDLEENIMVTGTIRV